MPDYPPITDPADYRIPFGRHRGKTLDQVPVSYLQWLLGDWWGKHINMQDRYYKPEVRLARWLQQHRDTIQSGTHPAPARQPR